MDTQATGDCGEEGPRPNTKRIVDVAMDDAVKEYYKLI